MYYLNLDEDHYLLSVNELDDGNTPIESIEDYDFSGLRLMSYRYEDGKLVFDAERYAALTRAQEAAEREAYLAGLAPSETELAMVELAGLAADNAARLDEQDAALCELAAMLAGLAGAAGRDGQDTAGGAERDGQDTAGGAGRDGQDTAGGAGRDGQELAKGGEA